MKWLVLVAFATAFMGCVKDSKPVLEVGQFRFSGEDLARRKKVLQFYFPNEVNPNAAQDLIKAYSQVQVALDLGFSQLRDRVLAEDKRVDETTLDPQGLARIKRIFDGDVEAYRRLYLVPILAPQILNELARRDREAQARSRAKIESFLKEAEKAPARFSALAKKHGLQRRALRVSEEKGVRFDDLTLPDNDDRGLASGMDDVSPILTDHWRASEFKQAQSEAQKWVREIAVSLKPGEVSARLVDRGDFWLAVKLLGTDKKNGDLRFECAEVPKDDVEKWIHARTKKVPVVGG